MQEELTARIHSLETFGALDGPGIRYVVFFQGCPLNCLYCHNPDSLCASDGTVMTLSELLGNILKYRSFMQSGGVTLSGGEPLMQFRFCEALLESCRKEGIHTAIDTSGAIPLSKTSRCIDLANMLLLDIKAIDPELCKKISGQDNKNALETLEYTAKTNKPVWIRHVLVPGLTLVETELIKLADYLKPFSNVTRIELLPFHKMGEYKWEQLKKEYTLYDTPEPGHEELEAARRIFLERRLPING